MAHRILVVEDEQTNREVAEVILRNQGFEILTAANGQEALEIARAERPDLIIMDILMPILDGLSATRQLKADAATSSIPILVVTAKASHSDRDAADAAGSDGFLTKPYRNKTLVEAVRRFLPLATP